MKLSDYVASFVARQHVGHVFFLGGGGNMHLVDSFGHEPGLKAVACLHEQTCSLAAEAYGEYDNGLGVALVTTGPGGTNCATGVAASWLESSPTLFISGQAKRADMILHRNVRSLGQQEIDVVAMMKPVTKYAVTVMDPASIRYHLEKAVYLAKSGRPGPAWIEIPLDVQAASIDEKSLLEFVPGSDELTGRTILREKAAETLRLIARSKRPVFLIGNGVRTGGAAEAFRALAEKVKIPVLLTWKAADILPEDHELYRGRPGGIGQRFANFTQQNADCIIVIGARLDLPSIAFDYRNFARYAKKIIADIDPAEILKFQFTADVAINCNSRDFIAELMDQAGSLESYSCPDWLKLTDDWRKKYPVVLPEYRNIRDYASTYVLMDILSELAAGDDVFVPGSAGASSDILYQAFKVKKGQRILNAPGLGSMGSGIPGAIGACLASGGRRTVCVNGDGGFMLNIQELETIRRLDLPIRFFVLNNNGYGSNVASQTAHFKRLTGANPASGMTLPDITKVAAAFGIRTHRIACNDELKSGLEQVLSMDGPVVCEVMISPDEKTSPRVTASVTPEGQIVSNPMEDMSPPLDRNEFNENMVAYLNGK